MSQPERRFGWSDMFLDPAHDPRSEGGFRTERDADFNGAQADPELVAEAWRVWREEVAFAEQYVDRAPDLRLIGESADTLREVMVHMIEEYARHNGHADLIRERIDGRVGQ